MASFIIHHTAGIKFLQMLQEKYAIYLSEEEQNQFLLGNLIVDSTKTEIQIPKNLEEEEIKKIRKEFSTIIQNEKKATHFRDDNDQELVVQVPNLEKFLVKYSNLVTKDLTVLGYFFHLYTDKMFFNDLFNETFECLDSNGNNTVYIKNTDKVRVKKNNKLYQLNDFFSVNYHSSIYNDYTTINKILLEYYQIIFDLPSLLATSTNFMNPGIEEVDYSKITKIIHKTDTFIKESYQFQEQTLNIFDENKIKYFIEKIIDNFMLDYGHLIKTKVDKPKMKIKK